MSGATKIILHSACRQRWPTVRSWRSIFPQPDTANSRNDGIVHGLRMRATACASCTVEIPKSDGSEGRVDVPVRCGLFNGVMLRPLHCCE